MTATLILKPKAANPAPADERRELPVADAAAGKEWAQTLLRSIRILERPAEYLSPEGAYRLSLEQIQEIRHTVDESLTVPGAMLALAFHSDQLTGSHYIELLYHAAQSFASRSASEQRKNDLAEAVESWLLQRLDAAILERCRAGVGQGRLILSEDFRGGLRPLAHPVSGHWLQAGLVEYLPTSHPVRDWPNHLYYAFPDEKRTTPAVILGPMTPTFNKTPHPTPRPFAFTRTAMRWTAQARKYQLQRQLADANIEPTRYATLKTDLDRFEREPLPKRFLPTPAPAPEPGTLPTAERLLTALQVFKAPHKVFTAPPRDTSLDDLFACREALRVDDDQGYPHKEASLLFAGRVAGESRKAEMADLMRNLLIALQRPAALQIEAGLLYAARQAAKQSPILNQKG